MSRAAARISPEQYALCKIGLKAALVAVEGKASLARELGLKKKALKTWDIVPGERVLAVERCTGVPRNVLRPDLFVGYRRRPNSEQGSRDHAESPKGDESVSPGKREPTRTKGSERIGGELRKLHGQPDQEVQPGTKADYPQPPPDTAVKRHVPFHERITCSIAEAVIATSLSRSAIYKLMSEGTIEFTKVGDRRLIKVASLARL